MRNRPALSAILATAAALAACTTSSPTTEGGSKSTGKADGTGTDGSDSAAPVTVNCDLTYINPAVRENTIATVSHAVTSGYPSFADVLGDASLPYVGDAMAAPFPLAGGGNSEVNGTFSTDIRREPDTNQQPQVAFDQEVFSLGALAEATGYLWAARLITAVPDFTYQNETWNEVMVECTVSPP
jgi:hypothetical protein